MNNKLKEVVKEVIAKTINILVVKYNINKPSLFYDITNIPEELVCNHIYKKNNKCKNIMCSKHENKEEKKEILEAIEESVLHINEQENEYILEAIKESIMYTNINNTHKEMEKKYNF